MTHGFWETIEAPFFALAPMYDVTDAAFRRMIAKYSAPDVIFTEFVSADGLAHPEGREKLMHHLWFDESEHHIVAQVFGVEPKNFAKAAELCRTLGFDGIDINMGCPEKNIVKQGTGAALITDPHHARDIIDATIDGAGEMPVSVKTRIGFHIEDIDRWLPQVLEKEIAALTVHLRTRKEMSKVPAHWDLMPRVVQLRDAVRPEVKLLGNGDVTRVRQGHALIERYGCDGVMIGRGVFGKPWLFCADPVEKTVTEKLRIMVEHTQLFAELFTGVKNFAIMKKHYKAYVNGFPEASVLRAQLMDAPDAQAVADSVDRFVQSHVVR